MLYTIGHTESYLKGLDELGKEFKKLGKMDGYSGGIVFLTREEADQFACERLGFSVFGLEAELSDTYKIGSSIRLKNTCRIILLE